ncbi:hypothetical protein [Polyangium sp. 6x1]|uniref:hypothetical protein n=1 Tax=Polyangium sp. 6x1 TaxID=3042689 RepID=UPI002482A97D|nr:hypothetical protein [Polyangium sp. 6x1]MDI1447557.1 hypothetical protein [Polyangium sp. 6x1]
MDQERSDATRRLVLAAEGGIDGEATTSLLRISTSPPSAAIECTGDPSVCPAGYRCICGGGGPSPWPCHCGLACQSDRQCTDPGQPICCGAPTGTCTDACTCYCD